MRRSAPMLLAGAFALASTASPLAAQTPTGPGKAPKPGALPASGMVHWAGEWASWTHAEVVMRLVQQPIKVLVLEGLEPERTLEIKALAARVEVEVREVFRSHERGEAGLGATTAVLESLVADYRGRARGARGQVAYTGPVSLKCHDKNSDPLGGYRWRRTPAQSVA